jgi:hypothetical protein
MKDNEAPVEEEWPLSNDATHGAGATISIGGGGGFRFRLWIRGGGGDREEGVEQIHSRYG